MTKEACNIKGTRQGLSLRVAKEVEFDEVIQQLRTKLSFARDFFYGATVHLLEDTRQLNSNEVAELEKTVQEFGMNLQYEEEKKESSANYSGDMLESEGKALLLRRTLRSGQKIYYDGNVVVLGDVNPGAEIACTGDILVLGSLRGLAHAGINGNVNAVVFAFCLEPTQLRIAHYISRAPDEKVPHPVGPELAQVTENIIQISAYN